MIKTVWKTIIKLTGEQTVNLPAHSKILWVGEQHGEICLWYFCNPNAVRSPRTILIFGTGHEASAIDDATYIGTVLTNAGSLVWHVFEKN